LSDPGTIDNAFTGGLKGGAEEPTFSGAQSFMRRRYSKSLAGADVAIVGIPFDGATSNRPGARFGPAAIRRASMLFDGDPQYPSGIDPFADLAVVDYGDCLLPRGLSPLAPAEIERQVMAIVATGVHLISLGGDHFISLPLLRAHAARHGPLAIVQFDAHQDTWDDGVDSVTHGSFINLGVQSGLIDASRSIQIGVRTIAPRDCGIEVMDAERCAELTGREIAEEIIARVGDAPCYLTFDVDALDPAYAPGTGTPVAGGLTTARALAAI
jgi:agmatinase